jgi:hypothetical protein
MQQITVGRYRILYGSNPEHSGIVSAYKGKKVTKVIQASGSAGKVVETEVKGSALDSYSIYGFGDAK